jgi:hypothetical protein
VTDQLKTMFRIEYRDNGRCVAAFAMLHDMHNYAEREFHSDERREAFMFVIPGYGALPLTATWDELIAAYREAQSIGVRTMTYRPQPNTSISHGTMRTQDLLRTFADELERLNPNATHSIGEARAYADKLDNYEGEELVIQNGIDCLNELFDALNEYAPEGCYFGSHPGDGADYGYWSTEDCGGWGSDFDG